MSLNSERRRRICLQPTALCHKGLNKPPLPNAGHVWCNRSKASCRKASFCFKYDYYWASTGSSSKFLDWAIEGQLGPYTPASCSGGSRRYNNRISHWGALRCLVLEQPIKCWARGSDSQETNVATSAATKESFLVYKCGWKENYWFFFGLLSFL